MADIRRMVFLGACLVAAPAVMAQGISEAETLLFQTDHLQRIHAPAALNYAYKKVSRIEPGFDDAVHVDVLKIDPDGAASVSMRFLSGPRKLAIPDAGNSHGNPVLLGFLERDIVEMKRLTGGSANYFRKRIRLALADAAQVRRVTFAYRGKQLEGREISVQPYLDDPLHERFEKYVNKKYAFILSQQLPGGVYQIRTSLPAAGATTVAQDQGLMQETLTLIGDGAPRRRGD